MEVNSRVVVVVVVMVVVGYCRFTAGTLKGPKTRDHLTLLLRTGSTFQSVCKLKKCWAKWNKSFQM